MNSIIHQCSRGLFNHLDLAGPSRIMCQPGRRVLATHNHTGVARLLKDVHSFAENAFFGID
jgi:hypothetical protein